MVERSIKAFFNSTMLLTYHINFSLVALPPTKIFLVANFLFVVRQNKEAFAYGVDEKLPY